ncbi:MAG: hypothetical protein HY921_06505 [Elusimicrobia bacterium]|nr:hypothetical protein [Elusimicrobiota bacterium]
MIHTLALCASVFLHSAQAGFGSQGKVVRINTAEDMIPLSEHLAVPAPSRLSGWRHAAKITREMRTLGPLLGIRHGSNVVLFPEAQPAAAAALVPLRELQNSSLTPLPIDTARTLEASLVAGDINGAHKTLKTLFDANSKEERPDIIYVGAPKSPNASIIPPWFKTGHLTVQKAERRRGGIKIIILSKDSGELAIDIALGFGGVEYDYFFAGAADIGSPTALGPVTPKAALELAKIISLTARNAAHEPRNDALAEAQSFLEGLGRTTGRRRGLLQWLSRGVDLGAIAPELRWPLFEALQDERGRALFEHATGHGGEVLLSFPYFSLKVLAAEGEPSSGQVAYVVELTEKAPKMGRTRTLRLEITLEDPLDSGKLHEKTLRVVKD